MRLQRSFAQARCRFAAAKAARGIRRWSRPALRWPATEANRRTRGRLFELSWLGALGGMTDQKPGDMEKERQDQPQRHGTTPIKPAPIENDERRQYEIDEYKG